MTKRAIREAWEAVQNNYGEDVKFPVNDGVDLETYINDIGQVVDLEVGIYFRTGSDGTEGWVQAEYYSKKLGKTIIWDYDWTEGFETAAEMIDAIYDTNSAIIKFEKELKS